MKNQSQVRRPPAQANRSGFTIVEVMIVMSVMAILLALALPNVRGVLARNQLLGQANELAAALQLARNEAVTRGVNAVVCPSANGTACDAEGNWDEFMLVFADNDLNGVLGDGDEILRVYSVHETQVNVTAGAASVVFNNAGFSTGGAPQFDFCHEDLSENDRCRRLQVQLSGAVSVRTISKTPPPS